MHNDQLSASILGICFGVTGVVVGFSIVGLAAMKIDKASRFRLASAYRVRHRKYACALTSCLGSSIAFPCSFNHSQ